MFTKSISAEIITDLMVLENKSGISLPGLVLTLLNQTYRSRHHNPIYAPQHRLHVISKLTDLPLKSYFGSSRLFCRKKCKPSAFLKTRALLFQAASSLFFNIFKMLFPFYLALLHRAWYQLSFYHKSYCETSKKDCKIMFIRKTKYASTTCT